MKQWRCKLCGAWIPMTYMRHHHTQERLMTVEEMRASREAGDGSLVTADILTDTWTPQHEMRHAPPAITE